MCVILLQVNTIGVISFRFPFVTINPSSFPLPTNDVLIAPFWDIIETFFGGRVLFRLTDDEDLLTQVGATINEAFMVDFSPALLLIVTWDRVPSPAPQQLRVVSMNDINFINLHVYCMYFVFVPSSSSTWIHVFLLYAQVVNTFQAVLATDGNMTYVMFLYEDIQWGSAQTTIGFNAGDRSQSITLPESLTTEGVLNLENTTNVGIPGVYIFRVDQAIPGKINLS